MAETLRQYDRIWCPDDDIACDTAAVNLLFDIFERFKLSSLPNRQFLMGNSPSKAWRKFAEICCGIRRTSK